MEKSVQFYIPKILAVLQQCEEDSNIETVLRHHFPMLEYEFESVLQSFEQAKKVALAMYYRQKSREKVRFKLFKVTYDKNGFLDIYTVLVTSKTNLFVEVLEQKKDGSLIVSRRRKKSKYTRYYPSFAEAEKDVLASEFGSLRQTKIKLQHLRTVHCQAVLLF